MKETQPPKYSISEITDIYNVFFGEKYKKVLETGEMVRNSHYPANGFSILRGKIEKSKWIDVSFDIQSKYFVDGEDLGNIEIYLEIGEKYGVNFEELKQELEKGLHVENLEFEDFLKKQELNVKIYPSVKLEKKGELYDLRNGAYTVEELENNLGKIVNE